MISVEIDTKMNQVFSTNYLHQLAMKPKLYKDSFSLPSLCTPTNIKSKKKTIKKRTLYLITTSLISPNFDNKHKFLSFKSSQF